MRAGGYGLRVGGFFVCSGDMGQGLSPLTPVHLSFLFPLSFVPFMGPSCIPLVYLWASLGCSFLMNIFCFYLSKKEAS